MKHLVKYMPAFLLLIYLLLFLAFKNPRQSWDRPINSDGKGYYAYLPALFIYHDASFRFVEQYENLYYPGDKYQFKEFRMHVPGGVVDKYYPGLAILWLPFFLVAHLLSILLGFAPDGYSILYQCAISIAALAYLFLGLIFLVRLLKRLGATPGTAAFITLLIALGTNIIFFTIVEDSMSHVYSFAMITIFLYSLVRLFESSDSRWVILSSALFALICLIRPVNGLIILMVPVIFELVSGDGFKFRLTHMVVKNLVIAVAAAALLFSIPVLYWYFQTGHPFVYSYGGESFEFGNQRFFSILFSYNRGWFIYTPVAFIAMAGLTGIFRKSRKAFIFLLVFLVVFIYVASSWWMWYYTSKYGQRVFIDIYAVTALLLYFLLRSLENLARVKKAVIALFLALTGLNLFQFYQHARFVFPPAYITREIYWDSFFSLYPKARLFLPENSIESTTTFFTDMEHPGGWMNEYTLTKNRSYSGKASSFVNKTHPYSLGLDHPFMNDLPAANKIIRISAMIYSEHAKTASSLVIDFRGGDKDISYNPFYLKNFARPDHWTKIEAGIHVPRDLPQDARVSIYFFNPTDTTLYIDDMKIDFLTLNDNPEFRRIEGVLLPCR